MSGVKDAFCMKRFWVGFVAGGVAVGIIFGFAAGAVYSRSREKEVVREVLEYGEKRRVVEELRENYSGAGVDELLEIPGVRGAADGAKAGFERKRDEVLYRFRNRIAD